MPGELKNIWTDFFLKSNWIITNQIIAYSDLFNLICHPQIRKINYRIEVPKQFRMSFLNMRNLQHIHKYRTENTLFYNVLY